jgi:hypothetical protein
MDVKANKEVVDYWMRVTGEKFESIEQQLAHIDKKLNQLIGFRMMLLGASAAVSAIVGLAVAIYFGK